MQVGHSLRRPSGRIGEGCFLTGVVLSPKVPVPAFFHAVGVCPPMLPPLLFSSRDNVRADGAGSDSTRSK